MTAAMLTMSEVMARLRFSRTKVESLVKAGKLRAMKDGRWRFDEQDLERYIELEKQAQHGPTVAASVAAAFDADHELDLLDNPFA